jgi:type I restriction enzyme R subunit
MLVAGTTCSLIIKQAELFKKLRDGKERLIQHLISTSFWRADGKPISVEDFLNKLYGALLSYFRMRKSRGRSD